MQKDIKDKNRNIRSKSKLSILRSQLIRHILVILTIVGVSSVGFYGRGSGIEVLSLEEQIISDNYYIYTPERYSALVGGSPEFRTEYDEFSYGSGEADIILLNFHADWCASCSEFEPIIRSTMEEIATHRNIHGFRVSYNDRKESTEGRLLAKKYGVTVPNTIIVLNRNREIFTTFFSPVSGDELKKTLVAASFV